MKIIKESTTALKLLFQRVKRPFSKKDEVKESNSQFINRLYGLIEHVNGHSHGENEKELIEGLDDTNYKYHSLLMSVMAAAHQKSPGQKIFICTSYLICIVNNSRAIRRLFDLGLHLQMEVVMRSQFEYINLLYCILNDDTFFENMFVQVGSNKIPKKPTAIITKKEMFKPGKASKESRQAMESYFVYLNDRFSMSAHGHFDSVIMASFAEAYRQGEDLLDGPLGGNETPSEDTKSIVVEMNNYSQILFTPIQFLFNEQGMCDDSGFSNKLDNLSPFLFGEKYKKLNVKIQKNS